MDLKELFTLETRSNDNVMHESNAPSQSALDFLEQFHRQKSDLLKTVIREHGWPSAQSISQTAEAAAFMIIQHADYDPVFQRACHVLLLESVLRGHTDEIGFLAFLTDRILCNERLPQRFGTQLREVTNGCFVPKAMENPECVDAMREQAGLKESLTDYLQRINDGDLFFYRFVLAEQAEALEESEESNILPFPTEQRPEGISDE